MSVHAVRCQKQQHQDQTGSIRICNRSTSVLLYSRHARWQAQSVCGVCMTRAKLETRENSEKISSRLHILRREACAGHRGSWHMGPSLRMAPLRQIFSPSPQHAQSRFGKLRCAAAVAAEPRSGLSIASWARSLRSLSSAAPHHFPWQSLTPEKLDSPNQRILRG